jgi:hypothetical protein
MAYFTAFDSAWGGGRSLGKRALDIAVVRADGTLIPAIAALARAAVVSVPLFIDHRTLSTDSLPTTAVHLIAYAALMATLYLFVFNRSSRQSLHDLALGTLVVRGAGALPARVSTWKGHWVVVGLIVLWTASNVLLFASDSEDKAITELRLIEKDVAGLPFVRSVRAVDRTQKCRSCSDRRETKFVALRLDLRHSLSDRDAVLRQVADVAFANHEQFFDQRKLRIVRSMFGVS